MDGLASLPDFPTPAHMDAEPLLYAPHTLLPLHPEPYEKVRTSDF